MINSAKVREIRTTRKHVPVHRSNSTKVRETRTACRQYVPVHMISSAKVRDMRRTSEGQGLKRALTMVHFFGMSSSSTP